MSSNGLKCGLDNLDSIKTELDVYEDTFFKKQNLASTDDLIRCGINIQNVIRSTSSGWF